MRPRPLAQAEQGRIVTGRLGSNETFGIQGAFYIQCPTGKMAVVISSIGMDWEHISVHMEDSRGKESTPTWEEMAFIKFLFWDEEEPVMQLHPPRSTYINNHRNVLHMWKPIGQEIPLPPSILVGIKGISPEQMENMRGVSPVEIERHLAHLGHKRHRHSRK